MCACAAVYLSSCERWLETHNRHAQAGQHMIAIVNYRAKLPQSLGVTAVWQSRIVLLNVPFRGSAPVKCTNNRIKRLRSPAGDKTFDGLLPSSMHSNIPLLKLLHRYSHCALSEFTSDCIFFFSYTHIHSSLVHLIYFNWKKKGELNRLDRT